MEDAETARQRLMELLASLLPLEPRALAPLALTLSAAMHTVARASALDSASELATTPRHATQPGRDTICHHQQAPAPTRRSDPDSEGGTP